MLLSTFEQTPEPFCLFPARAIWRHSFCRGLLSMLLPLLPPVKSDISSSLPLHNYNSNNQIFTSVNIISIQNLVLLRYRVLLRHRFCCKACMLIALLCTRVKILALNLLKSFSYLFRFLFINTGYAQGWR